MHTGGFYLSACYVKVVLLSCWWHVACEEIIIDKKWRL